MITNFMIDGNDWELLKWKLLNDWFSPLWEGRVRKNCWKPKNTITPNFLLPLQSLYLDFCQVLTKIAELKYNEEVD